MAARKKILVLLLIPFICLQLLNAQNDWQGQWITAFENQSETNTWIAFRKEFDVQDKPSAAPARIAVDSKYWLWINGMQVVFEGGVKRGPTPLDTYYDEVDIAPYLKEGKNSIAILLWYFGKEGFSHKSSGTPAMVLDCRTDGFKLLSDETWVAAMHPAYENTYGVQPNFRLSESNIRYDARRDIGEWYAEDYNTAGKGFRPVIQLGKPPVSPWNDLYERIIPLWKDYGLKEYVSIIRISGDIYDTIVCRLPYNAQITPWFMVSSDEGKQITIYTDHYYGGGPPNVRAEYITRSGRQEYESLGWMNGHNVYYIIPKAVEIEKLQYRETGFNSEFTGMFSCNDSFFNRLWEKAVRTLYITMRDTYMDCPDRERSQWWGDMVNESGEAFYALDPRSATLTKKGMLELIRWQRPDGTIFSPIPAGNWNRELPGQMLASIGYYGFWNYYFNTGDTQTIAEVYQGVKRYLDVWKLKSDGTLVERTGDWYWGDWGTMIDKQLLFNSWYYLALKGYRNMAVILGENHEATETQNRMDAFRNAYNEAFWDGKGYRTKEYEGSYDDRAQSLAVVSGLANTDKYPELLHIFQTTFLASPYMEKYVIEALFIMDQPEYGLERLKSRFAEMVNHPEITTLWEGWGIGRTGYGGGSTNHAWSGGGLTILSQYVAGIYPIEPAYSKFQVRPQLGMLTSVSCRVPSVKGEIAVDMEKSEKTFSMKIIVPSDTKAIVHLPGNYAHVQANKKEIFSNGEYKIHESVRFIEENHNYLVFELPEGEFLINGVER